MKQAYYKKIRLILIGFAAVIIVSCGSAKADFTFVEPENLGPIVNSIYTEVGPSISSDGLSLYFSDHHDHPIRPGSYGGNDLWVTTRVTTQDNWSAPINLGPTVNDSYHDMEPCVSADGLTLYFNSDRPGGYGDFDIWMTRRSTKESIWGIPVNLGPVINSSASETEPCISADGLTLYFDSNRTGSLGDYDLYISTRPTKDDNWLEPVNLGQTINSQSFDRGASISSDGLALFLTSGRSSNGYSYLWVTTRTTVFELWATPVNLGPIINRTRNQATANVTADGRTLLYTTNCRDGFGGYDIWQASIIPVVDFNSDENIDTDDLLILMDNWNTNEALCDIGPFAWGDGVVDMQDLTVFIRYWEQENFPDVNVDEDDDGREVVLKQGQILVVTLESNRTTGHSWAVAENQDSILKQIGNSEYKSSKSDPPMVGAGGWEIFRFKAVGSGQTTLKLIYRRPWETDVEPLKTFTIDVVVN